MATAEARDLVQQYSALKAKMSEMRKEFTTACGEIFREQAKVVFDAHPILDAFAWTQYTPYFNDGEACTFGVNNGDPWIRFKLVDGEEEPEDEIGYDDEFSEYSYMDGYGKDKKLKADLTSRQLAEYAAGTAVGDFLRQFDDEQYEMMFDDHAKIIVTREGVDVEEYSHD